MKKVISLVLCTIMVASLFVINTSAAVPMQAKSAPVTIGNNDGDNKPFVANPAAVLPSTATAKTITVEGNQVYELAFNGEGAYTSGNAYILCQYRDLLSTWWSNNFELYFDIMPINNTSGIMVSMDEISNILHVYPSSLPTKAWSTLKVKVLNKAVSVYIKEQGTPDSGYKKLIAGTDYQLKTDGAISSSTTYFGIDTRYSNMAVVDKEKYYTAKYYLDNLLVVRDDSYKEYGKNFVYTDDAEIVVDTEVVGSTGLEYKFAAAHDTSATTRSIVFDAVKTGGDRPINIVYAPKNGGSTFAFNIWNATQDVKYTYKVDYVQGSLTGISRKAEGSDTWEALTEGTDYSKGSIYGAWQYLKFGYLGTYYADKNDQAHLAEYCGPNPALDDINTRWTFSNFQITGYEPAISAIRSETATGHKYTVSAVAQSADYAVMIAVYDGETFAGAGVAKFNHEGVAEVNVDHAVANPTFKAFIWNTADESAPMMAPIDITNWVE